MFLTAPSLEFNFLSVPSEGRERKTTNKPCFCLFVASKHKGLQGTSSFMAVLHCDTWESSDKWNNSVKLHPHLYCTALLLTQASSALSEHHCTGFTSLRFCTLTASSWTQRCFTPFLILSRVEKYHRAKRQQHVGMKASPWSTELWSASTLTHCITFCGAFSEPLLTSVCWDG